MSFGHSEIESDAEVGPNPHWIIETQPPREKNSLIVSLIVILKKSYG